MLEWETGIIIETTNLRAIPKDFLQSVLQYHNLTLLCTSTKKFLVADTELKRLTTLGPSSMQTSQEDGQSYRSASVSEELSR